MSEPPPLANAEVGASCFKIKYPKERLKAGNNGFHHFFGVLQLSKSSNI